MSKNNIPLPQGAFDVKGSKNGTLVWSIGPSVSFDFIKLYSFGVITNFLKSSRNAIHPRGKNGEWM